MKANRPQIQDPDGWYTAGVDKIFGYGIASTAKLDGNPYPEIVLMITHDSVASLSLAGRIYLLEHDGGIQWGPVYLQQLGSETPPPYDNVTITVDRDIDGEPVIGIQVNEQYLTLDRDGYLKK